MYSIVLIMALNGSADVTTAHGCNGCSGCNGCVSSSCHGCNSCGGGHGFFGRKHGCCGGESCCGGSSCHGCSGCKGGHGFLGGLFKKHHSCNGCSGCHGCNGSSCNGCTGCNGGHACNGGGCTGAKPEVAPEPKKDMPKEGVAAPATIVVTIPADAKLTIDNNPTRSTAAVRTFVTPALEQGKDYYYNLKAEMVVDGQTQSTTHRVLVRAGLESAVTVEFPAAVASK